VPAGDFLQDTFTQPLTKFDDMLRVTGGTEVATFAGKCQQILMIAVVAFHPGKSIIQDSAIKILVNNFFYMRS